MLQKNAFICALFICFIKTIAADKINHEILDNYSSFFNFGDKKLSKLDKNNLQNDILKSKVDVLGEVLKKNIDSLKLWGKLDVIFLIDASSSVGEQNFKSEIKFVKKLLNDVTVDYDHTRIAIVTFSSKSNVIKSVDEITEPKKENNKCLLLNNELNSIKYIGGGTYTLGAFQVAKDIFENSRNDSNKVLFLITDGYSNGGDPVPLANELKKNKVTIFTIGIRNGNYKELYELSTSPGELYSYLLDSFQEFESLARRALHVDIKSGDYVPLGTDAPCNKLCDDGNCCDKNALCTCGTSTGHYTCLCQPGYYGSGLQNSCSPCPSGTFADGPNLCLPCPDIHHVTVPPANSINSCKCKAGYRSTKEHGCEIIKCRKLSPPQHGYFVRRQECGNVLNNACGVRCEVGYTLIGSSIRLCQTSGNWSGYSPSCQVKTCSALVAPIHGTISCTHEDLGITYNKSETNFPVDTVCTFTCQSGRVLTGSTQRTCLPLAQWDGLRASCKQIKCNKLSNIPHGKIEPRSCTMGKQFFGSNCTYSCQPGFKLSGPAVKSCTEKQGTWSNKSNQTTCEDVTPPTIACPKNIVANTSAGQNYGKVSWNIPKASDDSGLNISIWLKPAIKNITEFKFKIGKTKVTYFAQDAFRNVAKCNFTVEIKDNEPPIIEDCIDPITFLAMDKIGANISWDEPDIYDNSGNVTIIKSHEFGFFNIGLTSVTYIAKDPSNNTNTCVLNVTVQESQCEPLPDPIFGHSECTSMSNGIQCIVTCQEGYAIPISSPVSMIDVDNSSTQFICRHSDPVWYSEENSLFPDCTITEIPTEVLQNGVITVEPKTDDDICNDTDVLNELENEIRNDLSQNLQETCTSDVSCNLNTTAICENEEESEYEERTNIIKREVSTQTAKSTPNTKRISNKKKKVNVSFEVSAKVTNTKGQNVNLKSLNNIQNIPFLEGNSIATVVSVQVNKPKVVCAVGFVQRKMRCVQCPKGTFHNVSKGVCQSCALGFYNDKVAQSSCTICPLNHSTSRMHCKSMNECKAHCPPGTHSRRKKLKPSRHHPNTTIDHMTLTPHCRACPIGFYQPNYGQLSCRPCPAGYTTNNRKSVSINQCVPTAKQICENFTNICNQGKCVAENGFYYSCACERNYVGSHCETKINSCLSQPCLNSGICVPNSNGYSCTCKDGFSGKICDEVEDKCERTCYNAGKCVKNDDEEEACLCPDGFGGESCEITMRFCSENICENNGRCVEQPYGYKCICENGFIGKRCNILPCDYQPCLKHLVCTNINHTNATRYSYTCECPKGYEGRDCKDKINFCKNNPCLNNGVCTNVEDSFSCQCPKIFYGAKCENKKNGDYILNFPRSGTTDFVKLDGFKGNLSEISVCLWMLTLDSFNYGTLLSYATYDFDNAFTLTDYTGLVLYVNGRPVITDVFLNDGLWHFFCVTWQSLNGTYSIYVDGKRVQNGTGLANGTSVEGNGKMVIGQEQDVLGGRFSQSESFLGKIAFLDVWKRVLKQTEIDDIMNSCLDNIFGDVYAWAEIRDFVQGDVEILDSTFCQKCSDVEPLYNGLVEIVNNVAYYTCNPGFQINDPVYASGRKCTKASKWEGTVELRCKRLYCGHPGYIIHGQINGKNYYYSDQVKYVCQEGYNMVGIDVNICTENGTWSSQKPSCISGIQCKGFKKPEHSDISITADDLTDEGLENLSDFDTGTQIEITCIDDAKLEGEGLITCLDNGTWDYPTPKCIGEVVTQPSPIICPVKQMPQPPPNGYAVLETLSAYGNGTTNTIEFKCRHGYHLHGDNFTTCIVDGYWTEPNVSCDPIICGKPPKFRNMKIKDAHLFNGTYHFGNMVTFECAEGYRIFGNSVIRCLANGKWTKMQAKCTRKSCYKPVIKDSTYIEGNSYLYKDEVTLICSNKAKYVITCDSSGQWIGDRGSEC